MATLQFKGKSAVWNHHLSVPYHTLNKDDKASLKGEDETENLIIEGDNLLALKSLLPKYQGKIKCIYIDPPYNTGNEEWVFNDNVNSPTIRAWIGEVVGKEGEDLTRHDKWFCMMTPRMKLLRELLQNDGLIAISIDDNEIGNLISLCNEVFGENNRFGIIVVRNNPRGRRLGTELAVEHEYLVIYAKSLTNFTAGKLELSEEQLLEYSDVDQNGRKCRLLGLRKRGALSKKQDRPNLHYPLYIDPNTLKVYVSEKSGLIKIIPKLSDGKDGVWRWGKKKVESDSDVLIAKQVKRRETGEKEWDIFQFDYPDNEDGEVGGRLFPSIWDGSEFNNETGRDQIKDLFGEAVFDYPKPVDLIKHTLLLSGAKNGIILDSFAGSGTTGQATIELNQSNSLNLKYILIQLPEAIKEKSSAYKAGFRWVHEITRERVKRVIENNKYKTGFAYYKLGQTIDAETILGGKLPSYVEFAKYVFYLATGENHPEEKKIRETDFYVGKTDHTTVYLIYKRDMEVLKKLAITLDWAQQTHKKDTSKKIVYAPACYLDEEALDRYNIRFVSIPYNLFERER